MDVYTCQEYYSNHQFCKVIRYLSTSIHIEKVAIIAPSFYTLFAQKKITEAQTGLRVEPRFSGESIKEASAVYRGKIYEKVGFQAQKRT